MCIRDRYKEDAEEFINDFKINIIEELENYMQEGTDKTYSKAVGLTKKTCDMDPEDIGAKLLYSILCTITKNKTNAKEYLKLCIPKLEEYEFPASVGHIGFWAINWAKSRNKVRIFFVCMI